MSAAALPSRMVPDGRLREVAASVYAVSRERGLTLVAAGIAFYLVNALIPMVLFVLLATTTFGWVQPLLERLAAIGDVTADAVLQSANRLVGEGTGRTRATAIAVVILGYSAFTSFQATNMAFGHVYGARRRESLARTVVNTLVAFAAMVTSVAVLAGVGVALVAVTDDVVVRVASLPLLCVALLAFFLPMYVRFPEPSVGLREALPGALFAAVAWTAGAVGFRLYVVTAHSVQLYGVAGGVMLLLTWIYLGCVALLVGVVLNAVLADRVEPDESWLDGPVDA